jgi:hypothetical protein
MRKAEKRRLGEIRQAESREFTRQSGLAAQKRDRERREKAKREAEDGPVKVRKLPKKDAPKKFGKVTTSFREAGKNADVAAKKAKKAMDDFSEAFHSPIKE